MRYLIVVDMQHDFIDGALGTKEAESIVPYVRSVILDRKRQDYSIVFTRDLHDHDYLSTREGKMLPIPHCILGTVGSEIESSLDAYSDGCWVVQKDRFGTLAWSDIIDADNCEGIEIIGLCTDICVISNAIILQSMFPEVDITVFDNCCAGTTPKKHSAALEVMKSCQINVLTFVEPTEISYEKE